MPHSSSLGLLGLIKKITENELLRTLPEGFAGFRDLVDETRKINYTPFQIFELADFV